MGIEMLLGIGLSVFQGVMGIASAGSQAKAAASAANAQFEQQNRELTEQQKQADEDSRQKKGDRAREADRELSTLRVIAGETGGLGTVNSSRLSGEAAYFEGLDVARIESNRSREVAALQRRKEYAHDDASRAAKSASANARSSAISAVASTVGSGLQIYSKSQTNAAYLDAVRRR